MYLTPFTNYILILLPISQAERKEKKKKKKKSKRKRKDDTHCGEDCGYLICAAWLDSIGRGKPIKSLGRSRLLFRLASTENTLSKDPNH